MPPEARGYRGSPVVDDGRVPFDEPVPHHAVERVTGGPLDRPSRVVGWDQKVVRVPAMTRFEYVVDPLSRSWIAANAVIVPSLVMV